MYVFYTVLASDGREFRHHSAYVAAEVAALWFKCASDTIVWVTKNSGCSVSTLSVDVMSSDSDEIAAQLLDV